MWTRDTLRELVSERLNGVRFLCVANREPYVHAYGPTGLRCLEPVSGVVTAMDPVMKATGGTWVAHGNGSADRETADASGRLRVPPGRERYTLRRLWLSKAEEDGYYYGFANEALWPLCHIAYHRPTFEEHDWRQYVAVNEKFADAVAEEAGGEPALVFIHDYHFALLPKMVKQRCPTSTVFQFWHIPWPNPETFRVCPWKMEILEGLLGNDLLAFHIQQHCNNFMDTVDREMESLIDRERFSITYRGSPTLIRPHAIGVDFDEISAAASEGACLDSVRELRRRYRLENCKVALGVDRLDYTKGIPERLRAVDRLLERYPEFLGRFVFVEIGVPSRTHIRAYQEFQKEVESLVEEVNWKHGTASWDPVIYLQESHNRAALLSWYRLADVCIVSSLHDGMNLVAKEFVAAREDRRGALLLSQFTGAARELTHAVLVNPFAVDAFAEALHTALTLTEEEQETRMERLRKTVAEQNVYQWVGRLLEEAVRLEPAPW